MSQSNGGCDSKFKSLRANRTPLESVITCPKTPILADPSQQAVLLTLQKIHKELKVCYFLDLEGLDLLKENIVNFR